MPPLVHSFYHPPTNTWSHIAADPQTDAAVIIDPVLDFDPASGRVWSEHARVLLAHASEHTLRVAWILETHAHADHLTAAAWLKAEFAKADGASAGVRIGIGAGIVAVQRHFCDVFAFGAEFRADGSQFDRLFVDGERIALGALEIEIIATPGHTSDGITYRIGDAIFVGDTLFAPNGGTGRCDFPGADAATQYRSIKRLYALPDETSVFLCHDYPASGAQPVAQTTIGAEKAGNTQLRAETSEAEYVAFRHKRDATLAAPRLLYPSLQVNVCAGRLPAADTHGRTFLRLPVQVCD
ncbi:MAG TPA: MBL fold metallo-hydrolase [Rhodanobacteraceae bacterium]|nr:MBL fold metallo-hydrolase [Rhodanobacteraceae bacterium]